MLHAIRKKHKGLWKMSNKMTAMTGMGSSSAKQTKKEKIMWVDKAKKDAGIFTEAVGLMGGSAPRGLRPGQVWHFRRQFAWRAAEF